MKTRKLREGQQALIRLALLDYCSQRMKDSENKELTQDRRAANGRDFDEAFALHAELVEAEIALLS